MRTPHSTQEFGKAERRTAVPSLRYAALDKAGCGGFRKEGRMKCTNATKLNRKSGGA